MKKFFLLLLTIISVIVAVSCNKTYKNGDIVEKDGITYEYVDLGENYELFNSLPNYTVDNNDDVVFHARYYIDMVHPEKYPEIVPKYYEASWPLQTLQSSHYYSNFIYEYGQLNRNLFVLKDNKISSPSYYFSLNMMPKVLHPGFWVKKVDVNNIKSEEILIPSNINGYPIKGIGEKAIDFTYIDIGLIKKINIIVETSIVEDDYFHVMPKAIQHFIGESIDFKNNNVIFLPLGLYNCSFYTLNLPNQTTVFDAGFYNCQIRNATIGNFVEYVSVPEYDVNTTNDQYPFFTCYFYAGNYPFINPPFYLTTIENLNCDQFYKASELGIPNYTFVEDNNYYLKGSFMDGDSPVLVSNNTYIPAYDWSGDHKKDEKTVIFSWLLPYEYIFDGKLSSFYRDIAVNANNIIITLDDLNIFGMAKERISISDNKVNYDIEFPEHTGLRIYSFEYMGLIESINTTIELFEFKEGTNIYFLNDDNTLTKIN